MYVKVMEDDVLDELDSNASTIGNSDVGSSAINGLVSGHDELLSEPNDHAPSKDDPKRFFLDDSMPESARFRVDEVGVRRVGDDVVFAVLTANCVAAEAEGTVGKLLAVLDPVGVTPPASVYRVGGPA